MTAVQVDVRPPTAGGTAAYTIGFSGSTPLAAGDQVAVDFAGAPGTVLDSATATIDGVAAKTAVDGMRITVFAPSGLKDPQAVVELDDVVNPPRTGRVSLDVSTSEDADPVSVPYAIGYGTLTSQWSSVAPGQRVDLVLTYSALNSLSGGWRLTAPGWSIPEVSLGARKVDANQSWAFHYRAVAPTVIGSAPITLVYDQGGPSPKSASGPAIEVASVPIDVRIGTLDATPPSVPQGGSFHVVAENLPESCGSIEVYLGGDDRATLDPAGTTTVDVPVAARVGRTSIRTRCTVTGPWLAAKDVTVTRKATPRPHPVPHPRPQPHPHPHPHPGPGRHPRPHRHAHATLRAVPAAGVRGSTFDVRASGIPATCAAPSLYLSHYRLGRSADPVHGAFVARRLKVPSQARPAPTQLSLRCRGRRDPLVQVRFVVRREAGPRLPLLLVDPSRGPRGAAFAAAASGVPPTCATGDLYVGPRRVGSAEAADGELRDGGLVVPVQASPGPAHVVLFCAGRAVARATFFVTGARDHRTAFVLAAAGDGFIHHRRVLADAGLVALLLLLLVALIGFPADWFNDTYVENRERVRAGFWRLFGRAAPPPRPPTRVGLVSFLLVAGVLTAAATDLPAFDRAYLWALLGTTLGVAVLTFGFQLPAIVSARVVHVRGRLQVLAGSVGVAAVCVAASRALHLDPPYLYGLIAVFVVEREAADAASARDAALGAVAVLVLSVAAWLLDLHVEHVAAGGAPSPGILVLEAALVTVFVAGLGSMVFALVPLPFLPGRAILHWSRVVWLALFAAGAYAFALIMLTPRNGYVAEVPWDHVVAALVTFGVFAAASVAFMVWFRFVRPRASPGTLGP